MQAYSWLNRIQTAYQLSMDAIEPLGSGHIHQTFKISAGTDLFVLQEFNVKVFEQPERISFNHTQVLEALQEKNLPFALPLPIPNREGQLFTAVNDSLFRLSPYVAGVCLDEVEEIQEARLAAEAFAGFIVACSSIDATLLQDTIPGFNNLELRFQQLKDAYANTQREVVGELKGLVDFYLGQESLVREYTGWIQRLPLRVTHNDTKINNLIFSSDRQQVEAVIDLDTIMAGYVFYDFGDLVRTVACTQPESSTNWEKIGVDRVKFEALWKGFLKGGKGVLRAEEIASLPFGGKMMTCIMGFRFLADYLNGNSYYKIHYEEQNLDRAKNHMLLLQALEDLNFHP